jgi:hypothetical protein
MTASPRQTPDLTWSALVPFSPLIFLAVSLLALVSISGRLAVAAARAPQAAEHHPAKPKSPPPPAREQPMPFAVGETLNYRVSWSMFSDAASIQLTIPERRDLFGWPTWHFRATAHTVSPVRTLFALDDQFDSYTDTMTLESRQLETHLNELGKIDDRVMHMAAAGREPRGPGPVVIVPPGTRDALGGLYSLRAMNWQTTPQFNATVFDGTNIYDMRARCDTANETVIVPAGAFSASRVSISVFQYGKEVSAIHMVIWIADDKARTPVVIQADLPFGSVRAELVSASR